MKKASTEAVYAARAVKIAATFILSGLQRRIVEEACGLTSVGSFKGVWVGGGPEAVCRELMDDVGMVGSLAVRLKDLPHS